jgi:PAS domain S-box-containing protein
MGEGASFLRGYLPALAALSAAYWAAAVLGLQWAVVPGAGTALWPAAGIAFAGLIIGGLRLWPAIVIGRVLAALTVSAPQPLWLILGISMATMLGGLVPAWLLLRSGNFDPALQRVRDLVALALAGGIGGSLISAGLGGTFLWLGGLPLGRVGPAALNWALGFSVGVLVAAPLILSWWPGRAMRLSSGQWIHLFGALITVTALSALVFGAIDSNSLRVWHVFPAFVWVAIGFQVRGVSIALAITSMAAVIAAARGFGALALVPMSSGDMLFLTQQFIAVTGLTMLVLGAAVTELQGREAQAQLAAIVSSSPDAMLSVDTKGRLQSWNEGAERLFGYSAKEVIGRHFGFLLPDGSPPVFSRVLAGENSEIEALRIAGDGRAIDVAITAGQMRAPGGEVLGVAAVMRDITARRRAEDYQRLLINELNHRVKNTLAIIQAIAQQSFGGGRASKEAMASFEGRLMALSAAHDLLTRENWESASMRRIVEDAVAPHDSGSGRFRTEGPDLRLPPKTAVSLALALHELATNAAKYGALSDPAGHVEIVWTSEARGDSTWLRFKWSEHGGPPVAPPSRRGFGTRLIERSLAAEFEGEVKLDFRREGIVCTVDAPLPD